MIRLSPASIPALLSSTGFILGTHRLSAATDAASASDSGIQLLDLLLEGGWAMYPLGLLMLAMFYLIFHCYTQTGPRHFFPPQLDPLSARLSARDVSGARQLLKKSDTALNRLMEISLAKARLERSDLNREAMEAAFIDAAEGEENAVSQWVNYLNVIATVAPMVGLLGTVSGMIGAFQKIGQGGMGKPDELAGNIGEALITTATGLVIGIPAMIAYFYFRNRLSTRMIQMGQAAGTLMDCLEDTPAPEIPIPTEVSLR